MVNFQKLKLRGISEETYDLLRSKILAGELTPGQRVDVALVSKQLEVSRTPVNDALQKLAAQDLVQIIPRKGSFVKRISPRDLEHIYQMRQALEGKACELAVRNMDASKVAALRNLNARLSSDNISLSDHLRINHEFHRLIVQYSNNPMLVKAYVALQAHLQILQVYWSMGLNDWQEYSPSIVREHDQIIDSLSSNSPYEPRKLMEEHIQTAMMRLIAAIRVPGPEVDAGRR